MLSLRKFTLALLAIVGVAGASGAIAATTTYTSASAFDAATQGLVSGDFSGILTCSPAPCFQAFTPLDAATAGGPANLQGVTFSNPAPGPVNVNSAGYYDPATPPDLTVPYLVNTFDPTATDNIVTITLPTPETAFSLDFGTLFNPVSITFTLSNGFSTTVPPLSTNYATQFLGFVSSTPFTTITLDAPNPVPGSPDDPSTVVGSWVIKDFAYGSAVPEPATWALMLLGFVGLGMAGYRRAHSGRPAHSTV